MYPAWSNGDVASPNTANAGIAKVLALRAKGINANEAYLLEFECVGYGSTYPITVAQKQFGATRIAAMAKATGLPVNRTTVHGHRDINSVDRASCPCPKAAREAFLGDVIARANAILHRPTTTVTVKSGDTLSRIASAHRLTLAALLTFPREREVPRQPRAHPPGRHRPRESTGGIMSTEPGTIWGREPAMVLALVQAVIALVVAFGLNLTPDQIGAILAVTAAGARADHAQPGEPGVRDGYVRGTPRRTPTVLERPSPAKRHLAELRARCGLTTDQLIYPGGPRVAGRSESREQRTPHSHRWPIGTPAPDGRPIDLLAPFEILRSTAG